MNYSNIIENQQQSKDQNGMIVSMGPASIENCCVMGNKQFDYVFGGYYGGITVINCTVNASAIDPSYILGNVFTENALTSYSFVNTIKCTINGDYRKASWDSIEGITPNFGDRGKKCNTEIKVFNIAFELFLICLLLEK